MREDGQGRIGEDAHGPLEDGPAVHREVVKPFSSTAGDGGMRLPHAGPAQEVAPGPVRAELVCHQALVLFSRAQAPPPPAPSPKRGKLFWSPGLITRLLQSPPITSAHWLLPVATNCAAMTRAKTKPGARGLHVEGGAAQS